MLVLPRMDAIPHTGLPCQTWSVAMTFDPRARAAQIAKETSDQISGEWPLLMNDLERIVESALIRFASEVLTPQREKDAAVMHMTAKLCALPEDENERISRSDAMELVMQWRTKWDAANRAKSLEDGS